MYPTGKEICEEERKEESDVSRNRLAERYICDASVSLLPRVPPRFVVLENREKMHVRRGKEQK